MKDHKKIKIVIEGTIRKAHGEGGGDMPTRVYRVPKRIIISELTKLFEKGWLDNDKLNYYLIIDPTKITVKD